MGPMVGPGAVGGVVAGPVGTAATMVPGQFGAIDQGQQADPRLAAQPIEKRVGDAAIPALASSALMSLPGESIIGKLGLPASKSLLGAAASNVAKGAAIGGATMGGSDALVQRGVDPDADVNMGQVGDAALGGAVAVGGMHAVHAVPSYLKGQGQSLGDGFSSIKDRLAARADAAKVAAGEAADTAPGKKMASIFDSASDLLQKGKDAVGSAVDKVMKGEPLGVSPEDLAAASPERAAEMVDASDKKTTEAATGWASQMLADTGLAPDRQRAVSDAMDNVGTRAGQAAMAVQKKAWDLGKAFAGKIDEFTAAVQQGRDDAAPKSIASGPIDTGAPTIAERKTFMDARVAEGMTKADASKAFEDSRVKKSEDYSGTQQAILQALQDNGLAVRRPELFEDTGKINELAGGLRQVLDQMSQGPVHPDVMKSLTGVLGDDTASVMNSLKRALSIDGSDAFFKNLNEITAVQKSTGDFHKQLKGFMTPESQESSGHGHSLMELGDLFTAHAQGELANKAEKPTAAGTAADNAVHALYAHHFGDKADAAYKAVQKHAAVEARPDGDVAASHLDEHGNMREGDGASFDESGNRLSAEVPDVMRYGLSAPDAKGNSKSVLGGRAMLEGSKYAKQHLLDLKAKYPEHDVNFERLPGSDHGHITVEQRGNPGAFSAEDLAGMAHDTKKYPNSPSRINVEGHALDAMRIAGVMDKKLPHGLSSESRAQRVANMFKEGIAQLTEQFGKKIDVPDTARIGTVGGEPFTWGAAKKLDVRTETDKYQDSGAQELTALRKAYKTAKDPEVRAELRKRAGEIALEQENTKDAELGGEHDGRNAKSEGSPREVGKDAQIHEAARGNKPDDLVNRSNMDGSPRFTSDRANMREALDGVANELKAKTSKAQQGLGDKLKGLLTTDVQVRMTDKDQTALARVLSLKLPSERLAIINPLVEKYATENVAAKPVKTGAPEAKSTILADQIAKRQEYLNNPPKDYSTEVARGHLDWAAKQLERIDAERAKVEATSDRSEQLGDYASSLKTLMKKAKSVLEGDASLAGFEGSAPSPKELAAKKAAFLERAASGDKALLKELSTSADAKGLQRAAEALPPGHALDAVNARLSELVQDPDTAYGLGTKKYSLESTRIHNDLGRDGFAATHDSPLRHEGKFDWRAHQGRGEGADIPSYVGAQGAGTYLSTSDDVHNQYKSAFTIANHARASGRERSSVRSSDLAITRMAFMDELQSDLKAPVAEAVQRLREVGVLDPSVIREHLADPSALGDVWGGRPGDLERVSEAAANASDEAFAYALGDAPSPSYHVSVNADRNSLFDWDGDVGHEPEEVMAKFMAAVESSGGLSILAGHELRTGADLYRILAAHLGGQQAASEALQKTGIAGHFFKDQDAAIRGSENSSPNYVVYDDAKITTNYVHFDKSATDPARDNSKASGQDVKDHIAKVLGNTVKTAWATFTHAGEYSHAAAQGIVRLSVHALDPMSTAFHESFHAFAAQLRDAGAHDVVGVLEKAAASEHVMAQLTERFKGQPEVLKQLKDPEERAAYMYQMWAADPTGFKVSIAARNVFGKITDMIRKVMGVWSNDQRALHIMKYFNEGQYADNLGHPSVVRRALMEGEGRNKVYEAAKALAEPLAHMADAIVGTGSARLRDTGIPALNQLADLIKRPSTKQGGDQGYIQAARVEATKRLGALGDSLAAYTPEHLRDAMESLQKGSAAPTAESQAAADTIKGVLAETKAYMKAAGVDMGDLGKDYFPRVWDTHYISKNQTAFRDMLEPYIRRGEMKGTADQLIRNLINRGGSEFGIETREPGMQFKKERKLSFIDPKDASEFVTKELMGTLGSYINQATRKAEWSRRLGGGKLEALFADAKAQGATKEHLDLAEQYLKGVDGTLGDDLNPHARRIMGNMIVYQNIRLLPTAAFSMLIDPNGVMVRGGTLGDAWKTFKRGISEIPETYGKAAKPDEATRLAELTGVIDNAIMSHTMGDLYTQCMVGGTAKNLNNAIFKYNMVEGLNRSFRVGASEAAMSFLARHADGTHSQHSSRFMKELGIQAGDIIPTKDGRVALTTGEGLSAEQVARVHAAINQWVDGAVLRPDAADKPIWMNDPRFALVSHLKQFVFAFQETILKRTLHEFKHGNYTPAMALASYVPVMLAADLAKGALVSGGGQPEWQKGWDMSDYLGYAIQRAGLLGVGQFGMDVAKDLHRGGLGIGALSGPTAEQFGDTVSALGGHKQFGSVVLHSMPANALYAHQFGDAQADPMQAE